jgi:hypothetical protein
MCRSATTAVLTILVVMAGKPLLAQQQLETGWAVIAATGEKPAAENPSKETRQLSPEEKMQRRFPQSARVGDLIGLPVLDDDDRTIGHVKFVVRTQSGKLQLIVPYGGFLGWRQKLVAVPIEVVAIAGRQLAALDMTRAEFEGAPAWNEALTTRLAPDDVIRIALYRR